MAVYEYDTVRYPSRSLMCGARRDHYVALLNQGMNYTQAAYAVGVSKRTGKTWRNGRGRATGRNEQPSVGWYRHDMDRPQSISTRYLSQDERIMIADRLIMGDSLRAIAHRLDRNVSSISREITGNTNPKTGRYEPYYAHQLAHTRLKRPKPYKIMENKRLRIYVRRKLDAHCSPEQISGRLRRRFGDNKRMNVCAETIYQAIYVQARGELKLDIQHALRSGRTKRKPQSHDQERTPRFRDPMIMISERPAEVEDRAIPGHWEGDLITGTRNKSAIGTLVERATRFTILLYLPDRHDASNVQNAIINKMQHLPKLLRSSLTWDQGSELALHKKISVALDMQVYFCDPHSPWQRGTNENTNGLLRQYFPKGTNLNVYPEHYLDAVAEELNDRPRKILEYMKPSEKVIELVNQTR